MALLLLITRPQGIFFERLGLGCAIWADWQTGLPTNGMICRVNKQTYISFTSKTLRPTVKTRLSCLDSRVSTTNGWAHAGVGHLRQEESRPRREPSR